MRKFTLIVIHQRGADYERDFAEICGKVQSLDPEIAAYAADTHTRTPLPSSEWQRPTLVVALQNQFHLKVARGTVLHNHEIEKLVQGQILRRSGLPAPPAVPFRFGMKLDPILFGEFVLLKPMDFRLMSKGKGVQVMRRTRLESFRPTDMPMDHFLRQDKKGYIVQKLVNTGRYPTTYRVATFMGEVLYGLRYQSLDESPELTSPDSVIEAGNFTQKGHKSIELFADEELFSLARRVAGAFEKVPLLGIDFVRDCKSAQPFVLEVNSGGNTWHFASPMWAERRRQSPELIRGMKRQLSAFDAAARGLAETTRRLAS